MIDEAAARLRTEIDSMPAEMDEISRKVLQLEIEREALKKKPIRPVKHGSHIEQELNSKQETLKGLKTNGNPRSPR